MHHESRQSDLTKLKVLRKLACEAFEQIDAGNYITLNPDEIDAFLRGAAERAKARAASQRLRDSSSCHRS